MLWRKSLLLLGSALLGAPALSHETTPSATDAQSPSAIEPLYSNLGRLTYPISTSNELAQQYFDQGLRWTHSFNHAAAQRAFQEAYRQDPSCAICYWGEAFVLGPNINAPMVDGAINPAVVAINKARELAHHASASEQALIDALSQRYSETSNAERSMLDKSYAEAMAKLVERFPADQEIKVLYADAVMNLSPWDYWESDGHTPKGEIGKAIAVTEKVLAENPDHPGAIHLYIHLTEASSTPQRAEQYADRLADLMPGAGHLVHMGSHTFYRIGRFHDSVQVNKKAVQADETYFATVEDHGLWSNGYYPHNIHFVLISALMAGDAATALEYVERLKGKVSNDFAKDVGWLQAIMQAPYFAHAHLSQPETILGLQQPGDEFPYVKAAWHYARGVTFARMGQLENARIQAAKIADINQRQDPEKTYPADLAPAAPDVLRIARHIVEGRIAQAEGDHDRAAKEFDIAAQIQDSLPYLEPPFWYYPVRQTLGATLIAAGKPEQAEGAFRAALERVPNNGWALYGLMLAQQAQGKSTAAKETEKQFRRAWARGSEPPEIERL